VPEGTCPRQARERTFNTSPNRETDVYSVNATPDPGSGCMPTIAGTKVTAEPFNFTYHFEGVLTGEEFVC
jgi:hypothetical protein